MRGDGIEPQPHMWSYVPLEQRIPADHPLRPLRAMVDVVLRELSPQFDQLYSRVGRPSIPPEHLLRALLLQVLYSVRSERLLMEQLDYNLLFRWFVGLAMDDRIWDATVFTKNRERLLRGDIAQAFFERGPGPGRAARPAVRRALHGRRHADRRLGEPQELQAQGRPALGAGRSGEPDGEFPRRTAEQCHPRLHDGSAGLACIARATGREAKLCYQGHVADGESPRPGRRRLPHRRRWLRRTGGGARDDRARAPRASGSRWAPTKPMTPATSSGPCGCSR